MRNRAWLAVLLAVAAFVLWYLNRPMPRENSPVKTPPSPANVTAPAGARPKVFWFIPDGMRAEPDLFNIYQWAAEGRLPNIRKMMQRGTYGYCKPAFPGHTPANFATLLTGAYPEVHGVNDGPMHTEGYPLSQIAVPGFSSVAKKVEPVWVTLEKAMNGQVTLLSIPGSTPPELKRGVTIRGRWGRWGADFHSVNFQDKADAAFNEYAGNPSRLFYFGPQLTQRIGKTAATNWTALPQSYSPPLESTFTAWGAATHACLLDTTDNGATDYDAIAFSHDKKTVLATLKPGAWSHWLPITLQWQIPGQGLSRDVATQFRIKVIRLETNGLFRVRFVYNNLNPFLTDPDTVAAEVQKGVGPMVDFVDNFPPQLIFYPEDKATFLEESDLSLRWHRDAATFLLRHYQPDIYLQNIYTPNQMLTSRWWMGYIDPASARYNEVSAAAREQLWQEVHALYKGLDDILGRILEQADDNTLVVLSSDHGAVPLDTQVRLNNLFAREGLLKFTKDPKTGERVIDWKNTKAIYLKMFSVFLHPDGLDGNWKRGSGPEYEALRRRVKDLLLQLKDDRGVAPVEKITEVENAAQEFRLLGERSGDLIIANRPGYGWSEETSDNLEIFAPSLVTGYKQAVLPDNVKGMWTPFMMAGPGVKTNHFLGPAPVAMVDQYPTIFRLLGQPIPRWVQGQVVTNALKEK